MEWLFQVNIITISSLPINKSSMLCPSSFPALLCPLSFILEHTLFWRTLLLGLFLPQTSSLFFIWSALINSSIKDSQRLCFLANLSLRRAAQPITANKSICIKLKAIHKIPVPLLEYGCSSPSPSCLEQDVSVLHFPAYLFWSTLCHVPQPSHWQDTHKIISTLNLGQ